MWNKFLIAVAALFFCVSCTSETLSDIIDAPEEEIEDRVVTYNGEIAELIENRCLRCHSDPPTNGAPFALNTFDLVVSRSNTSLNSLDGSNGVSLMPPDEGLAPDEIALFQKWIDDGLLENEN